MEPGFFQKIFLGNTIEDYCWFLGIVLTGFVLKKLFSRVFTKVVFRVIKKYSSGLSFEKLLELLKQPVGVFVVLLSFYLAFNRIDFPPEWKLAPKEVFGLRMLFFKLLNVSIVLSITWILLRLIDFFGLILFQRASMALTKADEQLIPFMKESIKIILAIFSLFFILGTIFNVNIASLIAGLGIGGLALALAAKESLENLLGSFTIFFDKPFSVGDTVQIGHVTGKVEKIGFRSTRIRTPEKSFVTVPNKKMVEAELDNLTLRNQRRVRFTFGIDYETSPEKIKSILRNIQEYFKTQALINQNDCSVHLFELGSNSANILVEFYVETHENTIYMKIREEVNLKIMEIVANNESRFLSNPSKASQ